MGGRITALEVRDVRFPTSDFLDGSDAMNPEPDYSAAFVGLETDQPGLAGSGLTFTIGRGNEICCRAIEAFRDHVVGRSIDEIAASPGVLWRDLAGDSPLRWLGPEKGVIHLATAALANATWDLLARRAEKPLWRLLAEAPADWLVAAIDFRHLRDVLPEQEALERLRAGESSRAARVAELQRDGYPAYVTSAGWLGYDDGKIRLRCREAIEAGWRDLKIKVGGDPEDDLRRARIVREEIGPERGLLLDANQVWDVEEAIGRVRALAECEPEWIEEPTSPDDVLGHARIREAVRPVRVATGEHCHNRVMWKQFFQHGAVDYCQLDGCRLGGVNEVLAVLLLASKFDVPVCPHAGGVGLCELNQHFSFFDYARVSGRLEGRRIEFADHLHEHFVHPARVEQGRYLAPEAPGASLAVHPASLVDHEFPDGKVWRERRASRT